MDIISMIRAAGVVGAGGAGFPTHVKLSTHAKWLILNAAECEPLLQVDQQLCENQASNIVRLMALVAEHLGVEKAVIGIKKKHVSALNKLSMECNAFDKVTVYPLEDFYPVGDEQILVAEITGLIVPELGIPIMVGCVVLNVETLINIGLALAGKPITRTCLTMAGDLPRPGTYWLPIGMSYREVLEMAGAEKFIGMAAIDGGPMMGRVITNFSEPIIKTTKGVIFLEREHPLIQRKTIDLDRARRISRVACEQCRMCTDLCPRYLIGHNMQPHKMMRKVNYNFERLEDATIAQLCCECNLCELFSCPVNLVPKSINVLYKQKLKAVGLKHEANNSPQMRNIREYRRTTVKRLIMKLGLKDFERSAPLLSTEYIPKKVTIPLKQHLGASCIPMVSIGDSVEQGQLIGEIPEGVLGARIHASISGIVEMVGTSITICDKLR